MFNKSLTVCASREPLLTNGGGILPESEFPDASQGPASRVGLPREPESATGALLTVAAESCCFFFKEC